MCWEQQRRGAERTGAKEVDVYGDARYRSKDEVRLQIWYAASEPVVSPSNLIV